jgi:hypothetical protein
VLVAALLLVGCQGAVGPRPEAAAGPVVTAEPTTLPASDVLRGWDQARSRAFAEGDVAALRRLYVDGSDAGTSDARLLRSYLARGLRVEGMRMQLLALEVLDQDPRRLRVRVTDRLTGAVAVGRDSRTRLPRDQATTRVVELRRAGPGSAWRVAAVS